MSMKEIRVGLIGHQFMGLAHSHAFRNAKSWYNLPFNVVMKGLCAKDTQQNLAEYADRFGWESSTDDWESFVDRNDLDVISIATPGFLHKEMALRVAQRGKHVLCEKPLANNLADAREMCQAVQKAGVINCCGYSYRSTPAVALARQFVQEGKIGRIFHVHVRYAQDWIVDPNFPMVWRFDKKLTGTGPLGDLSAHSIDLTHFITGLTFKEVVGNLQTLIPERPMNADDPTGPKGKVTVEDVGQFLCNFDNGATGCYESTRMGTGRKNHNCIEVNGEKGSLYWNFEEQNYLYYYDRTCLAGEQGFKKINVTHDDHPYNGGYWPQGHGIGYADTFVIEMANFLTAIAEGKSFNPDFEDGLKVQTVLDAVEHSAEQRQWIKVLE